MPELESVANGRVARMAGSTAHPPVRIGPRKSASRDRCPGKRESESRRNTAVYVRFDWTLRPGTDNLLHWLRGHAFVGCPMGRGVRCCAAAGIRDRAEAAWR